tara:strand:+ start:532 stop:1776 length:1245 start_codon:yes stop_codon:yes gene_type:complete
MQIKKSKPKKILIIGSSLYSSLLANTLGKNNQIYISTSKNKNLGSFESVKIKNYKLNNGFHAIDLPRTKGFFNFLKKNGIKFFLRKKIHKIMIEKNIMNLHEDLNNWPKELIKNLKKNFKIKNNFKLSDYVKRDLLKIFLICSKRFSDNFEDCKHLFIPWFLPRDYKFETNDEGYNFRKNVSLNKTKHTYAVPISKLFSSIQKRLNEILFYNENINFLFKSKINFDKKEIILSDNSVIKLDQFDKIIYGENFLLLLFYNKKNYVKKLFKNKRYLFNILLLVNNKLSFTEIICMNSKIPNLNRISVFKSLKNKTILQLEILSDNSKITNNDLSKIKLELRNIFKLSETPKLIGYKNTRTIFSSSKKFKERSIKIIKSWLKKNKIKMNVNYDYDGPINMAKSWNFSKEMVQKLNMK